MDRKYYYLLIVSLFLISNLVYSQNWKDSARLGFEAYKQKDFKKAQNYFLSAQSIAPEHVDFTKNIATSAYRANDFQTASQAFERIFDDESPSSEKQALKYHNLGNTAYQSGNYNKAIDYYKRSLRILDNDDTRFNLALAKRKLKEQEEASKDQQDENEQNQNKQNNDSNSPPDEQKQSPEKDNQPQDNNQNEEKQNQNSKKKEVEQQLSQQRIDRVLDELSKKELETQQRIMELKQQSKGTVQSSKQKNW